MQLTGDVRYNGHPLEDFNVRRTAGYVEQVCGELAAGGGLLPAFPPSNKAKAGGCLHHPMRNSGAEAGACLGNVSLMLSVQSRAHALSLSMMMVALQIDNHNPNFTVRETLDFAHTCQVRCLAAE